MQCAKCANEAGSGRFCRSCGAPVAAGGAPRQVDSVCPSCGAEVRPGAKFCGSCAAPLGQSAPSAPVPVATTICVNCGAEAKADTRFCKSCGKAVELGTPTVTSDEMPTAVIGAPVRPAAPPPPPPAPTQSSAAVERAPRPLAPPAARVEPPPAPRLVAKGEPVGPTSQSPASGGSHTALVIAGVAVFCLLAAGAVYKFVLHKPGLTSAPAVDSQAAAQPAPSTAAEPAPTVSNPDPQPAQGTEAQVSTPEGTPPDATSAAGNSPVPGNSSPTPARAPKRPAAARIATGYVQAHANAEQALAASMYLNPPDGSALFWARKAKALGDPAAAQIEQQVFSKLSEDIAAARHSHLYDQAQAQLYQLASSFPEHAELRQLQDDIHQEQQRYTQQMEEQRRQAELQAQTKKFAVQHRHGAGGGFCTGQITINPDGTAKYDCTTADNGGRCEHVVFSGGSLKEVKVKGDGSLHVASRQQGNFDFTGGEFAIKDAASSLGALVKH